MSKLKKQRVAFVTGAAGFIGSHLCEELLFRGFRVSALDDYSTGFRSNISHLLKNNNFKFHKGTILSQRLLRRLVKECDVVYHLAAAVGVRFVLNHPIESILTNVEGVELLLEFAAQYRKKVLITSTSEVYGKHICAPCCEADDSILGASSIGRWSYATAKVLDEFLALAYAKEKKLPVVIARLFNTTGPRQVGRYGMVLPRFVQEALSGKPITIYGDGLQIRSFSYVKDVVGAMVDLSMEKKAEGEIFNVGNDQPITMRELARKVKDITNSQSPIEYISYEKAFSKRVADFEEIACRIPNISKLKKLLGYQPRYDIDAIIENTVEYFRMRKRA